MAPAVGGGTASARALRVFGCARSHCRRRTCRMTASGPRLAGTYQLPTYSRVLSVLCGGTHSPVLSMVRCETRTLIESAGSLVSRCALHSSRAYSSRQQQRYVPSARVHALRTPRALVRAVCVCGSSSRSPSCAVRASGRSCQSTQRYRTQITTYNTQTRFWKEPSEHAARHTRRTPHRTARVRRTR